MSLPSAWAQWADAVIAERTAAGLLRRYQTLASPQGARVLRDGRWLLNFCSNDYLGLAADARLRSALQQAVVDTGVGAGASALVCGHHHAHDALAEALADWLGVESVLLFGNGYLANLGVLQGLAGRDDAIFQDRLNHASLLDGGLASGAAHQRYRHADVDDLQARLHRTPARRRLVVSDGVFSMDGDIAPLPDLLRLAQTHEALLVLDEAHAFGVLGEQGCGSVSHFGLAADAVPLRVGTLGKAFGVYGAFVAGPRALLAALQQLARPGIYTTALPPALAMTTLTALQLVRDEDWRRQHLQDLVQRLRAGLLAQGWTLMASDTPIQPVLLGSAERALAVSKALAERAIWVAAIRPPTVPAGTARLRLTLTATHTHADVDALLDAMAQLAPAHACLEDVA